MEKTVVAARTKESLGEMLARCRTELGWCAEEVSAKTGVPLKTIVNLEKGDYGRLHEDIYTKISLKGYAAYLGLDVPAVIAHYNCERAAVRHLTEAETRRPWGRHPAENIPTSQLTVVPKIIRGAFVGLLVVALCVYFGTQIKKIITPPSVALSSPLDGLVTTDRNITVEGQTEPEASVSVSGKQITPDGRGKFTDSLDLQEGLNVIKVIAKKKHSREMIITRRIIVEPKDKATAVLRNADNGL